MKFLVVLCLMAAGANALYGPAGIVMPNGKNIQFSAAEADNIVSIGPSGVIKKDGNNVQLTSEGIPRTKREVLYEGPSGVHFKDGQLRHLPVGVKVVLMSEAGAVLSNGDNVQFRKKRAFSPPPMKSIEGSSGYITPTRQLYHLPQGVFVAIEGDTGALLSDGTAIQFYE